ncbi:alcohol dehydrogenase [Thraustotheca clavata]|uniref:Alcohol dehydrogenase n=1 Tax=Thraustotheca clavata TaxID=74557 RepID=A0A1V9YSR8_9STRA|nr:alcohol dehydrogenase [Thraustotheca clavata]
MSTYRKIVCNELSTDFRGATSIVSVPKESLVAAPGTVVVKNHFLGINASDINFTNGKYLPGVQPPFDVGFEAVGEVVEVGPKVKHLKRGDAVMYSLYGAFAEYIVVPIKFINKVPMLTPSVLPLNVCGLTASIALDVVGEMKQGEVVLVTAAAGATGQFAVQLAKLAGNTVIGTCSSKEKQDFLLSLGCDRAIDYTKEDVDAVLKKEFPRGVNVVFESVGGSMLDTCVANIARHGRIIVIGAISGYQDASSWNGGANTGAPVSTILLSKSASLRGFFLNHHASHFPNHAKKLGLLVQKGLLDPGVDPTPFRGLESVPDAIEYMYARKNVGKLVVDLTGTQSRL